MCHSAAANDLHVSASFSLDKILNVFQRIRLRFFRACDLASASIPFPHDEGLDSLVLKKWPYENNGFRQGESFPAFRKTGRYLDGSRHACDVDHLYSVYPRSHHHGSVSFHQAVPDRGIHCVRHFSVSLHPPQGRRRIADTIGNQRPTLAHGHPRVDHDFRNHRVHRLMSTRRCVVIFDLNGTLTHRDSYLAYLAGFLIRHPQRLLRILPVPLTVLKYALRRINIT
jgi:hypothetical protein